MSSEPKAQQGNLCERLGKEHDVELFSTDRHWHVYRCMRCDKVVATVPREFTPGDVTLEA